MDSKIRRMAILASMGVILLVSLLVLYANGDQGGQAPKGTARPPAESSEEDAGQQGPGKGGVVNGQIGDDLSAFLKDDTFFDPESNPILEAARDNASRLSMMVTSVEKDLRIQIVDTQGELVTGESFLVRLDGLGEYKDLDKDGVIYIGDLEPQSSAVLSFEEEDQRALSAAIKLGAPDQVERAVGTLMERLRQTGLSLSRYHLFLLEVVTCLVRLARSGGVAVEEVFGANFTGSVSLSDFSSPEELGRWLAERCLKLHELLGRQRTDSAWRLVEQAKEYIAGHYSDESLSVEALCSHIHLSPTYFSTLFKREVGMSFTAYVTQVRMDEAVRLLRDTDEKTYRIAERTGYSDPNYFSYVFKRRFGVSPSKYRMGLKDGGGRPL